MRLVNVQKRLAAIEAQRVGQECEAVGLVWSADDERIPDFHELEPGEHTATDVHIEEAASEMVPARWRTRERFTREEGDQGVVYDAGGAVVGDVVKVSRSGLITLRMHEGHELAAGV